MALKRRTAEEAVHGSEEAEGALRSGKRKLTSRSQRRKKEDFRTQQHCRQQHTAPHPCRLQENVAVTRVRKTLGMIQEPGTIRGAGAKRLAGGVAWRQGGLRLSAYRDVPQ